MKTFLAITTLVCLCFLVVGSVFILHNFYVAIALFTAISVMIWTEFEE
jgi:hypothetical protein